MSLRRVLGWGLIATFSFAALAIGTVHATTRTIVFTAAAALLVATLVERLRARRSIPITVPTVALAVAVLATAAQLVPLPPGVLGVLSPTALDLLGPGAHPLSIDPPATTGELAKLGAYFAFTLAAITYASRSTRRRQLVVGVAALATAVAVIGLIQAAAGTHKLLFFYTPDAEWATFVRGTFVNPNHFGGLLCLGVPCALALAICEPRLRWPAYAATFVMNIAVVFTLARAAIAAVLIGQAVVFAIDRLQLRRGAELFRSRTATLAVLALAIAGALGLAVVAGRSRLAPLAAQLGSVGDEVTSPLSKFGVWRRTVEIVDDYPWTGVGRGAFEPAFTRVSEVGGFMRYQWAENGYLEAVLDWGVPVALLLFLLAGWGAILALRRLRDEPLAMGPVAALFALAIHEAADFSVELPGVALPALALVAAVFGRASRESEPGRRRVSARAVYLFVPLVLLVPAYASLRLPSAEEDAARLAAMVADPTVKTDELLAAAAEARDRHPADYYLRLVVAGRLARELHPESLRWLNETMVLNPTHPLPHVMAAEVFAATGHKAQALVEYRLATDVSHDPREQVWPFVFARYPDDLVAAASDDADTLALLAEWLQLRGRPDDARRALDRALAREPANRRILLMSARMAGAGPDRDAARAAVERLLAVDRSDDALRLRAHERLRAGDLVEAAKVLDGLRDRSRASADVELELARAYPPADVERARDRLERLLRWPLDRAGRAAVHEARAEIERAAGNEHLYRWELDQRDRLLRP